MRAAAWCAVAWAVLVASTCAALLVEHGVGSRINAGLGTLAVVGGGCAAVFPGAAVALWFLLRREWRALGVTIGCLAIAVGGAAAVTRVEDRACRRSWPTIIANGRPVIAAIRAWEAKHGAPPKQLEDLVPGYLPRVLPTGVPRHGSYRLASAYGRDRWSLEVLVSHRMAAPDMLVYWPGERYPSEIPGTSGDEVALVWLEPVHGGWALQTAND